MKNSLYTLPQYQKLMKKHIKEMIEFLLENSNGFNVVTQTKECKFNPPLPKSILEAIGEVAIFAVVNYSFETAAVEDDVLSFEAGFGAENFGSKVEIPLLAIRAIMIGEELLLINTAEENNKKEEILEDDISIDELDVPAFLKNPENQHLLKKKRDKT